MADFCCPDRRLIVEIDGAVHDTTREHDVEREALLASAGYRALRFPNNDIRNDLSGVLEMIRATAEAELPRPALPIPRTAGW